MTGRGWGKTEAPSCMLQLTQLSRNSIRWRGKSIGDSPWRMVSWFWQDTSTGKRKVHTLRLAICPQTLSLNIPWQLIWFNKLQQLIQMSKTLLSQRRWFDWNNEFPLLYNLREGLRHFPLDPVHSTESAPNCAHGVTVKLIQHLLFQSPVAFKGRVNQSKMCFAWLVYLGGFYLFIL